MATKNNPGPFDCYAHAAPDEPMFILLARDECAPDTIRSWCAYRVSVGQNKPGDDKLTEAYACADAMDAWLKTEKR